MKTGVFGGTFDPPHNGHLYIARQAIERKIVDKVLFVPVFSPPQKKNFKITDYKLRIDMLKKALKNEKNFYISEIEKEIEAPNYTYKTLKALKSKSGDDYYLIIGKDQLLNFNTWYKWKEISEEFNIVVFERSVDRINKNKEFLKELLYTEILSDKIQISSTDIREKINKNENISNLLPEEVEKYIKLKKLYKQ